MLAGLLLLALPALALELSGQLVNTPTLSTPLPVPTHADTSTLPLDAYVDLDFGAAAAPFRADGSFSLCVS